jgi:hypothetical protein
MSMYCHLVSPVRAHEPRRKPDLKSSYERPDDFSERVWAVFDGWVDCRVDDRGGAPAELMSLIK